jgi:hypothetical protein
MAKVKIVEKRDILDLRVNADTVTPMGHHQGQITDVTCWVSLANRKGPMGTPTKVNRQLVSIYRESYEQLKAIFDKEQ